MEDRETLLQEKYVDTFFGEWKVLVTCLTLNRTTWMQAEKALERIFVDWPTPYHFTNLNELDVDLIRRTLKPLGFGEVRTNRLIRMSRQFTVVHSLIGSTWSRYNVPGFAGCGQYASDAWDLFVLKKECNPSDRRLKYYAERVGLLKL